MISFMNSIQLLYIACCALHEFHATKCVYNTFYSFSTNFIFTCKEAAESTAWEYTLLHVFYISDIKLILYDMVYDVAALSLSLNFIHHKNAWTISGNSPDTHTQGPHILKTTLFSFVTSYLPFHVYEQQNCNILKWFEEFHIILSFNNNGNYEVV